MCARSCCVSEGSTNAATSRFDVVDATSGSLSTQAASELAAIADTRPRRMIRPPANMYEASTNQAENARRNDQLIVTVNCATPCAIRLDLAILAGPHLEATF